MDKFKNSCRLAWTHASNLAKFVFIYKAAQCLFKKLFNTSHPITAFFAGIVGAFFVWRHHNNVSQQIMFYLLSRILEGSAKRFQKQGILPVVPHSFEIITIIVWGIVMFLFDEDSSVLQRSLTSSMDFLYTESNAPVTSWKEFVPFYIPPEWWWKRES